MLYQCLRDELAPQGVLVGSVKPGIIDSPMQEVCRNPAGLGESKLVGLFQQLKDNEYKPSQGDSEDRPHVPTTTGLDTAANCAHFIRFLLQDTADDEYKAQEWDIRDPVHHSRWVTR
jgi:benzil reductase ((S)-benzoin forming)